MDKKMLNTTYDFELADESTVKLTLTFYALYQLKRKNKPLYERYNKIMVNQSKGNYDELENIEILYTAYLCANMSCDNLLTEEEFIMLCGTDRQAIGRALEHLLKPKNSKASANRS